MKSFVLSSVSYTRRYKRKLGLNDFEQRTAAKDAIGKAKETAPWVMENLAEEFPHARQIHDQILQALEEAAIPNKMADTCWLYGKWMKDDMPAKAPLQIVGRTHAGRDKTNHTIHAKPSEEVRLIR
jgi:hypothetical protein